MTFLPNRGAVVSDLSIDEVVELLEIRIALECHALRLAIPAMGDIDLDDARAILRSYDDEPDPEKWGAFNWRFHKALYAPCNRPRLLAMIEANYGHVGRFTRALVSRATGKDRPQREHYQLLELLPRRRGREGRAPAARAHRADAEDAAIGAAPCIAERSRLIPRINRPLS